MNTGETNLARILETLSPKLQPGSYVFCRASADLLTTDPGVICTFKEEEGTSLIVTKELADRHRLEYSVVMSWITLTVHSSLEAVGLTAAFSKALADENISCNIVAAFYHDHIFVPEKDVEKALTVLGKL